MKTFLTVLGMLSLIGAVVGIVATLGDRNAVAGAAANVALMQAAILLAAAKVIELQEQAQERATNFRKALLEKIDGLVSAVYASGTGVNRIPSAPGTERYYVAVNGEVQGPHDREALRALVERKVITHGAHLLREGTQEWRQADEVIREVL